MTTAWMASLMLLYYTPEGLFNPLAMNRVQPAGSVHSSASVVVDSLWLRLELLVSVMSDISLELMSDGMVKVFAVKFSAEVSRLVSTMLMLL